MTGLDVVTKQPDFEFFGSQLKGWNTGNTPENRGYIVELMQGFTDEIQVPWMYDLRLELLEPTARHGTDVGLPESSGRPSMVTLSDRDDKSVDLIGGEIIFVDHPENIDNPQAPAFFRATILGTRITEERLASVNLGPANLHHSMKSLRHHTANPDFPIRRFEQEDGTEFFRGNPSLAADYIRRTRGGASKLSTMLNALGEEVAAAKCEPYVD